MLIDYILENAKKRYGTIQCRKIFCGTSCQDCTNPQCNEKNCYNCLHSIHWPQKAQEEGFPPREYDCVNMADYYVLQFGVRYASEILYAWGNAEQDRKYEMSVLSIGCGPCTDLFAFDYLLQTGQIASLKYYGTDLNNEGVWSRIYSSIKNYPQKKYEVYFNYGNADNIFDKLDDSGVMPNVIVFQYVFSDMVKRSSKYDTLKYIRKVAKYVNDVMPTPSVIIMNDINTPTVDDCFSYMAKNIASEIRYIDIARYFYSNFKKGETKKSGTIYETNDLLFSDIIDISDYDDFSPLKYCASAQRIIVTGRR